MRQKAVRFLERDVRFLESTAFRLGREVADSFDCDCSGVTNLGHCHPKVTKAAQDQYVLFLLVIAILLLFGQARSAFSVTVN